MKNLFKKLVGIVAALAIVAAVIGPGVTAEAAVVSDYTWEFRAGSSWQTVPADMKVAIASIEYDGTNLTITSAGEVEIRGVLGEIVTIRQTDSSGNFIGGNLLQPNGKAVISNVSEPFYVYFDIELETGSHSAIYTRISNLIY